MIQTETFSVYRSKIGLSRLCVRCDHCEHKSKETSIILTDFVFFFVLLYFIGYDCMSQFFELSINYVNQFEAHRNTAVFVDFRGK